MNTQRTPDQRLAATLETIGRSGNARGSFRNLFDPKLDGAMTDAVALKEKLIPIIGRSKTEELLNASLEANGSGWNRNLAFAVSATKIGFADTVAIMNRTRGMEETTGAVYNYATRVSNSTYPSEKTLQIIRDASDNDTVMLANALGSLFRIQTNALGTDSEMTLDNVAVRLLMSARIVLGQDRADDVGKVAFGNERFGRARHNLETVRSYGP